VEYKSLKHTQPLIEKRKATNKSKAELEQLLSDPQGKREAPLGLIKSKEQREVKNKSGARPWLEACALCGPGH